jgi:hypothetical protein
MQPWHPIQEDITSPDEVELKEIEGSTEHSALDHEYWESKAFLPLEDCEYTAGDSGRIHWNIDAYNGTREKPNRDIVMKSEAITVGGHQWQIKFYPKGNDSDYLSVYLECMSVMQGRSKHDTEKREDAPVEEAVLAGIGEEENAVEATVEAIDDKPTEATASETPVEYQHAPIPLLGDKKVPKRKCVAAQVSVVLYNPSEPLVNYSRTALHRFCSGSPDWGWTRFHGPCYDIAHRMRGQRQALLRDDKLAFTAYIRVIDDKTNCLWEHHSRENPWDSFSMTGLQGLVLGESASTPGGNMISAVASWMLYKPFRTLLYNVNVPDPYEQPFTRPKPLISALQKTLYLLRTQVDPGAGPVSLEAVLEALEWYGIHDRLDKLDVIATWEVLRMKLEEELQDTAQATELEAMLGPKRDYVSDTPLYRVPVVGVETMQEAVKRSTNFVAPGRALPQLLTIELDRQDFDIKTRSYVKLLNKVTLDDQLTVGDTLYTLYGFVAHKQTLQSYVYQPILRPEGLGSRWYSYSDSKDENQVRCLTKRQAMDDHEGRAGSEQIVGNDAVAYIALYIRDDVAQAAFVSDARTEEWDVPGWIRVELEKSKVASVPPPMPLPMPAVVESVVDGDTAVEPVEENEEPPSMLEFRVVDSRAFDKHEGPGFFDAYDSKWNTDDTGFVHTIRLSSESGCGDICKDIAALYPDLKDSRQITFWFMDPLSGSIGRPQLMGTGKVLYSRGTYDRYTESKVWTLADFPLDSRYIWVKIIDFASLPELPTEVEGKKDGEDGAPLEPQTVEIVQVLEENNIEPEPTTSAPLEVVPPAEDTPMSDPDESAPVSESVVSQAPQVSEAVASDLQPSPEADDTPMVEIETASMPDPPIVDVLVPSEAAHGDTEMGGTQEEPALPAPLMDLQPSMDLQPPIDLEPPMDLQPPAPVRAPSPQPPPEEIYFFLKLWNSDGQVLGSRKSHVVLSSARVDETVVKILGLPLEDKKALELWEEDELTSTRPIKHRRSFAQLGLQNGAIIIAGYPQTPEEKTALTAKAASTDPKSYLAYRANLRNFPQKMNGHFVYNYFSDEYYKGEIKNGHRHGHGNRIYHSGATYEGSFRLGQRHGHGLYTFQNGDTYDGDWVNNQQHGSGTFVEAATGNTYVGGWKNDKKFGEGVTHWKSAQEAERLCRICWDEPAEAAFYDCGHVVACLQCAREVQNCPVCRKRVLSAMKLYYVA